MIVASNGAQSAAVPAAAFIPRRDDCKAPRQAPVTQTQWRTNATPQGVFQEQGYSRTCANGVLEESVTMVVRNGEAKLAGYQASSPLLLTD